MGEGPVELKFVSLPEWVLSGYGSSYGDGYSSGSSYGDGYSSGYGDGYGYGSGDSSGYGSSYGDSSGYGSSYGDGYSSGYGYGDGYGDGSGSGSGSGDSSGDSSGDGSGDSSGDGYGYGYWMSVFQSTIVKWTEKQRSRLEAIWNSSSAIAFWKSDKKGLPCNNGTELEPAAPGITHNSYGPLNLCNMGTLHATMNPDKWKGERLWVVALFGNVKREDDKFGALEREIMGEIDIGSKN